MAIGAGWLADRYRKLTVMAVGMCILSISFLLLALTSSTWSLVLAIIFIGMCIAISITPSLPAISEHLQHVGQIHSQGQGYALFNLAYSGGAAIGSLVSGIMYERLGLLNTTIVFSGISAALAVCLLTYCYFIPDHIALAAAERKADLERQAATTESIDTRQTTIS